MDAVALQTLHSTLAAGGYLGTIETLDQLLSKAESDTQERTLLARWATYDRPLQHASLVKVFAHARKHAMAVSYASHSYDVLTLSQLRTDHGVRLGRLELFGRETRFIFYKGNERMGERSYSF